MNAATMIDTSALLFVVAALGGLAMAIIRFSRNQNPPTWLAMLHGLLAAAGLTLLLYAALVAGVPGLAQLAAVFLLVAALGGLVLNLRDHWRNALLSSAWVVGHAAIAVIGFVLLAIAAWGG